MYTSAQALNEVLVAVSQKKQPKTSFRSILAEYLGLDGEDGELKAVMHLHKLVARVRDDIEAAEIERSNKQQLKTYMAAFNGILNLSIVSQNLEKVRESILKPDNLVNLTIVHMALDGKLNRYDDGLLASELSADLDETRQKIADSALPEGLKKTLDKRLNQIKSAVDHFRFYGIEGLQEALSILTGDIFIRTTAQQRKENSKAFDRTRNTVNKVLHFLHIASKAMKDSSILVDEVPRVIDAIENLGNMQ